MLPVSLTYIAACLLAPSSLTELPTLHSSPLTHAHTLPTLPQSPLLHVDHTPCVPLTNGPPLPCALSQGYWPLKHAPLH